MVKVLLCCGHEGRRLLMHLHDVSLVTLSSPEKTPVIKHVFTAGVQGPVISFPWVSGLPRDFHEAVI